jgi:uncharacterized protein YggE
MMRTYLILGVASIALCAVASAQENPQRGPEITASGHGEIKVPPTHAILYLIVETPAGNAAAAASENARVSQATIQSLRNAGVKENEISNGGYSLSQNYERDKPKGFIARNTIRVDIPVANVGKAIDAAVATGSARVSPIQFHANELSAPRREALRMAVEEARRDAEVLAEASGGSLGRLLSMSSVTNPPNIGRGYADVIATGASSGGYVPTDIRPNDLTVVATASGRWEFIPRR